MKETNKNLLDRQEEAFRNHLMWIAKEDIKNVFDSYKQLNSFVNHTLILSTGIAGVVIPLLIGKNEISSSLIYLSVFLFVANIILGIINMSTFITGLPNALKNITHRQESRILAFIKEIQDIKLIEDNNEAGNRYDQLIKRMEPQNTEITKENILDKLTKRFFRFEVWFFATFICGVISLFLALFGQ